MGPPRLHHYLFVHRHLRDAFFRDPAAAVEAFRHPEAAGRARRLWAALGEDLARASQPVLAVEGLAVSPSMLAGRRAVVITLPAPEAPSEAWFVALVGPSPTDDPRYLTLERSVSLAAEPGPDPVMLCEWTADGKHVNYGPQTGHTLERFEALVEARLR